jgi:hypothetical protein
MFAQRIFLGALSTSEPYSSLETIGRRGSEKAVSSPVFTANRSGPAVGLSTAGWGESRKRDSFLHEQTGNVTENKGGPEKAAFSPVFTVNRPGAAARLSIAGWVGRMKGNSFLQEQTGNVIENKGGPEKGRPFADFHFKPPWRGGLSQGATEG